MNIMKHKGYTDHPFTFFGKLILNVKY